MPKRIAINSPRNTKPEEDNFEPKILAFLCNWCGYAAADQAGISRIHYATNIRIIRVTCSGRVDPRFIIEAFLNHIDGVLVVGCYLGNCHYISGNSEALKIIQVTKKILESVGVNRERLGFEFVSAAEGPLFAEIVNNFVGVIVKLGSIEKEAENLSKLKLRARTRA